VGFGYGLALMATQSVVVNLTSLQNRSSAVASLEAGYFSGFISSTAVGGMLAEKIGYRGVFFVGSLLVVISIIFVLAFLMQTRKAGQQPAGAAVKKDAQIGVAGLFTDRVFMGSLLLSAIPSALCLVGFLYFASPLLLAELGVKQSNIARLMMPYGLCMVYIAPMISRWVDGIQNKRIPVVMGGFLGGLALLSFLFLNSVALFVVVLVLFALSGGMSYGARISTISESPAVKAVGAGKALGVFNSLERIGNTAGPIAVGGMIGAFGLTAAISNLGIIYLLGTILFFVVARKAVTR
jgi:predicted MFS family arabinose efflux permease